MGLLCACILMSRWVASADAVRQKDLHRHCKTSDLVDVLHLLLQLPVESGSVPSRKGDHHLLLVLP